MIAAILALMMFVVPAAGVPAEEMLQDTLKSALVAFFALVAALVFFWQRRKQPTAMRWHAALALPLLLMLYALGSMAWSHTYLAGVEAIRWFLFTVLMALALNTFTRERLPVLSWGIAAGAAVASLWAVLQFLLDFSFFPQGPHPSSTFINRNFFAEFAVCTIPFIALLLARAQRTNQIVLLSLIGGEVILAILMTGTRSALIALWLQLGLLFPLVAWRCGKVLAFTAWPAATKLVSVVILLGVVCGAGAIPTADAQLAGEGRGVTALQRAFNRTASIAPGDPSLSLRLVMWRSTARMIMDHPVAGVGAGAWENAVPLYQQDDRILVETDYYAHNEFLQLVAEYGLVGWAFLAALLAWLARAAWRTWKEPDRNEAAWRAILLASLASLLIVSNAGFAWRMASTGALFALCLGALAASDLRLAAMPRLAGELKWRGSWSLAGVIAVAAAIGLASHITWLAALAEAKLVRATRIAIGISQTGDPNNPRWNPAKAHMLNLLREGIRIDPHYRKITPVAADELARWGDWRDAIWVWESVLSSRPYIVAILTNTARGYMALDNPAKAAEYIDRAKRVQPNARSVLSAQVLLYAITGRDADALGVGRQAMAQGIYDFDLVNAMFIIARRNRDYATAEEAMRLRLQGWDRQRVQGWLQLAEMRDREMGKPAEAAAAYEQALSLVPVQQRAELWSQIPPALRARINPSFAPDQTSASKG